MSPSKKKHIEYKNINDVNKELIRLYDKIKKREQYGNALFTQSKFFVDTDRLVDEKCQRDIKKYNYSKASKTPPYPTIQETPYNFIDNFLLIEEEINNIEEWLTKTNT